MADLLDNLGDIDLDITSRLPRSKPIRPEFRRPLGEEEYKSLGRRALDTGLGALEYIGGALAKPGYAARGVLAGRPSALKNLIPFSDTLGVTDEADHTSGRDLANLWGLTRKNDQGWGAWGTGLALDMLTDPLTYVGGFGPRAAQTGIGRGAAKVGATKGWTARELMQGFEKSEPALQAAGKTSEEIAHEAARGTRIASPQAIRSIQREVPSLAIDTLSPERTGVEGLAHGGLIKLTGPFGYGPSMVLGTGKRSQQIAGLFDKAGDKLKFGNRFGRTLNTLFDPRVQGATTEATQRAAFQHGTPVLQEAMERGRLGFYDVRKELDPALKAAGGNEELALNAIRAAGERAPDVGLFPGEALQGAQPAAAQLRTLMDRQAEERIARGLGKNLEEGTAGVEYVPRQASEAVGKGSRSQPLGNQKGPFPTATAANIHRKEWLTDLPAGSGRINDWFSRFAGSKDKKGAFGAIYTDLVNDAIASGHLQQLNQPAIEALEKQAKLVASRVTKSDLKYRAPGNFSPQELQALGGNLPANAGQPFLSPDLFGDIQRSTRGHAHALANQASLIGGVAANAEPMREGLIPLPKLIRRARLQTTQAEGQAAQGALVDLATALAKPTAARPGMGLFDYTRPVAELQAELGKYGVRPELAKEFLGAYERPQLGEGLKPVVGAFDSFNNLFRSLVYPLFPASHVRNAMTATASNLREGTGLGGYGKGLRAMTGNTAADEALRRTLYGYGGVFEPYGGFSGEISGLANKFRKGEPISPSLPGANIAGPYKNVLADTANLIANEGLYQGGKAHLRALTQGIGGLFDKNRTWGQAIAENLGIRGVGGATTDVNPLIQTGRKVGGNIEDFFRGSLMSHLMDQGYSPSVAADVMRKLHFDPQDLTQFERNVMKRIIPFYGFSRRNLPLQVETLLTRPRVINAQLAPFRQPVPEGTGYIPSYLQGGLATPTGPEENGKRQYISGFGLPIEEAFGRFSFKNGLPDLMHTGREALGMTSPLIKAPLEQLFDTQLYSGRKLSDLRPQGMVSEVGRAFGEENPQALAQLIANTPASRFVSSIDKLMDPRKTALQKALNLGTGLRITDVDVDRQRAIETRDAIANLMSGHPNISKSMDFYVRPEDIENLTPEEVQLMRLQTTQKELAAKKAREGKKKPKAISL